MASRSERREAARVEAGFKLALFAMAAFAFLIGGISGFARAFLALAVLLVVVAVAGLASWLILRSRLLTQKKAGLLLLIASLITAFHWKSLHAPLQWPEERATVTSITGLSAVTETDYAYRPDGTKGGEYLLTQSKSWERRSEARNYQARPTAVYYNRSNPHEARFEPVNGWARATANPVATRLRELGEGTATLRIGSPLMPKMATTTGPHVANYTVGESLPVWIDPVSQTELSFQPRTTKGGQKYWMVAMASAMALTGLGFLAVGKQWIDPSHPNPTSATFVPGGAGGHGSTTTSIAHRLRSIDWFQFEAVSARILEADGWVVQKSGGANPDGGADLIASRNGRKAVVQCKHWRRVEIQPKVIRELLGTRSSAQFAADEAILFSLSECTRAALECARENNVVIFNSGMIEAAIERLGISRFPELLNPDDKRCPKCGAPMVLRDKVETPFWGCSTFPRCRGTIERA